MLEGMDHLCETAGMRWRFEVVVWSLWQSCQGMTPLDKELQVCLFVCLLRICETNVFLQFS